MPNQELIEPKFRKYAMNPQNEQAQIDELFNYYRDYGFPNYNRQDYKKEHELDKICAFDERSIEHGVKLTQTMHGCGFLWTYFPHWIDVECNNGPSLAKCWANDDMLLTLIKKTYHWQEKHGHGFFTVNRLRQNAKVYCSRQAVSNFRPTVAKFIMNTYGNNGAVWDMCSGWGGRLLGFLASDMRKYIGTEPSSKTYQGLQEIKKDFSYVGKEIELYCRCSEDFQPTPCSLDLCFTSPPYYDTEHYSNESTQSYLKYPTYQLWAEKFLGQTIKNCYVGLKPGGILALNIANTPKYASLERDACAAAIGCGFSLYCVHRMVLSSIAGKGEKTEPIFIFRKDKA